MSGREKEHWLDFVQVDAFTPVPLAGNPAAVLFTQRGGDEGWMQAVAEENNLSETAFLEERGQGAAQQDESGAAWDIRWFTPGGEVDLCGHATLGAAHALWDTGRVSIRQTITFHTLKAGTLLCSKEEGSRWIKMDFPAQPSTPLEAELLPPRRKELAVALGVQETDVLLVGRGPPTTPDWLVELRSSAFAAMVPDSSALAQIKPMDRGVIATCAGAAGAGDDAAASPSPRALKRPRVLSAAEGEAGGDTDRRFDFLSRFFAPTLGIPEDPVTGSAHCVLAPYWAGKLQRPDGTWMQALQASPRGGVLRVRYQKSSARVEIEGQAVTVLRGQFLA